MSNEHNNPPVTCGNGCDCLAQCGDTYAHAGLPKPPETEKAATATAVPQGWKLVMVEDGAPANEPDWDEVKRQAEVSTGIPINQPTYSIIIREIRRWLIQRDTAVPSKPAVPMSESQRADMICAVAAICTGTSSRTVAATAIEWAERYYGITTPAAPSQPAVPQGWRFKRNEDDSIGIFAPPPKPGESQRTSHAVHPGQSRDLHELLGKLADQQAATPAHAPAQEVGLTDEDIDAATRHLYHGGKPASKEYRVGIVRAALRAKGQS